MDCPQCSQPLNQHTQCPNCSFDLNNCTWVVIRTATPPEDAVLESLIDSFGIPVRLIHSAGSVLGLSIGPLGEVKIAVPEVCAEKAINLLHAELDQADNPY